MLNKLLLFWLISFGASFGQELTTIKGTISNFDGTSININIYPNWMENVTEHYIPVDSNGRFEFEATLQSYNYIDLNIGKLGYLFWLIEGGDNIYLLLDYNKPEETFFASGKGAVKFEFQHDYFLKYEFGKDAEYEIKRHYNLDLASFSSIVDSVAEAKQSFLQSKRKSLKDEFFLLKKAEILGKRNRQMVEYAQAKKIPLNEAKKQLEFYSVSPERQALSFEFNDFYDEWIALNKSVQDFTAGSLLDELKYLRTIFFTGQMERPITELKMHQTVLRFVDNHTYLPEMQKGVDEYEAFVRDEKMQKIVAASLERKKKFYEGFETPLISLIDINGKDFNNKDLKKNHTLFYVYHSDCIICEDDFEFFDLIRSNFDKKDRLQVYTIKLKADNEFDIDVESNEFSLIPTIPERFIKSFDVKKSPEIYFIDLDGKAFGDFPEPAFDEGRSLIKAIRDHMPVKDK